MSNQGLVVVQEGDRVQVSFGNTNGQENTAPKVVESEGREGNIGIETALGLEFYVATNAAGELVRVVSAAPADKHIGSAALSQWVLDGLNVQRCNAAELGKMLREVVKASKAQREAVVTIPAGNSNGGGSDAGAIAGSPEAGAPEASSTGAQESAPAAEEATSAGEATP